MARIALVIFALVTAYGSVASAHPEQEEKLAADVGGKLPIHRGECDQFEISQACETNGYWHPTIGGPTWIVVCSCSTKHLPE